LILVEQVKVDVNLVQLLNHSYTSDTVAFLV
jgi:hypothetical protein